MLCPWQGEPSLLSGILSAHGLMTGIITNSSRCMLFIRADNMVGSFYNLCCKAILSEWLCDTENHNARHTNGVFLCLLPLERPFDIYGSAPTSQFDVACSPIQTFTTISHSWSYLWSRFLLLSTGISSLRYSFLRKRYTFRLIRTAGAR